MTGLLTFGLALLIVGAVRLAVEVHRRVSQRQRLAEEQVLAEWRLRQVAQDGFRQMLEEARRDVG